MALPSDRRATGLKLSTMEGLPSEIYSAIIAQLTDDDFQQTVLALTRALPRAPIPHHHLFAHVRITSFRQPALLYRRLRASPADAAWVRRFSLETFAVDADVVLNLVRLLPQVTALTLFIGQNFAPEHLEDLFERPMEGLKFLSLRFRPYVQKATYQQFLKGAYFDGTLTALAKWPPSALPVLSIVQDPLPSSITRTFAQPLVFFRLDPFTVLCQSPYTRSLTSARIRIPGRQVARHLAGLPSLSLLDLSTCALSFSDLDAILTRFVRLKHLVVDSCGLLRGTEPESDCVALGKLCVLASVQRAKHRERKLRAWLEAQAVRTVEKSTANNQDNRSGGPSQAKRGGRRGIATATISLRAPAQSSNVPVQSTAHAVVEKIRVLPPAPSLGSFATPTSVFLGHETHPELRAAFESGWEDGIGQLRAIRARLRTSWSNGIRVMRFAPDGGNESDEGFDGLVDVGPGDEAAFDGDAEGKKCPVFCLAGPSRETGEHVEGCGHQASWDVWDEV